MFDESTLPITDSLAYGVMFPAIGNYKGEVVGLFLNPPEYIEEFSNGMLKEDTKWIICTFVKDGYEYMNDKHIKNKLTNKEVSQLKEAMMEDLASRYEVSSADIINLLGIYDKYVLHYKEMYNIK